jgi:hypothetical protein
MLRRMFGLKREKVMHIGVDLEDSYSRKGNKIVCVFVLQKDLTKFLLE